MEERESHIYKIIIIKLADGHTHFFYLNKPFFVCGKGLLIIDTSGDLADASVVNLSSSSLYQVLIDFKS